MGTDEANRIQQIDVAAADLHDAQSAHGNESQLMMINKMDLFEYKAESLCKDAFIF